jgi:cell division protein FtsI/penicillin-binding protein 2
MPRTKTTKPTSPANTNVKLSREEQDNLLQFEQFVSQKPSHNNRGRSWLFVFLIFIIVILAAAVLFVSKTSQLQKETKYKSVTLDNGLVYYGKIVKEDAMNIYMNDVYYIITQEQAIPAVDDKSEPTTQNVPVLVKRGQELHQPIGWLQINRSKVLAIEEIGPDSQILLEIKRLNTPVTNSLPVGQ